MTTAARTNAAAAAIADSRVCFKAGDRVRFPSPGGGKLVGIVEKLNPKRAKVRCGADIWSVPYGGLEHHCIVTAKDRRKDVARLEEVAVQARALMDSHGLQEWTLRFNTARKKLGECQSHRKLILLSQPHAVDGPPEQVVDTILHEIAHALAGPKAGHGPAWKVIANRLGATPRSCAPESDGARQRREAAKANFRTGDTVSFIVRKILKTGVIVRMNPKRAKVECDDAVWSVPYTKLRAV